MGKLGDSKGEAMDYTPIPAGVYDVQVDDKHFEIKDSSNGNPMLVLPLKVASGPNKGAIVWDHFVLIKSSIWRLANTLSELGFDENVEWGDPLSQDEQFVEFINQLNGMRFKIEVTLEPDNRDSSKNTNRVGTYYSKTSTTTTKEGKKVVTKDDVPDWAKDEPTESPV